MTKWDDDPVVAWLNNELVEDGDRRSEAGRRTLTALALCDRAFLTRDSLIRVLLSGLAVEAMFASGKEFEQKKSTGLQVARRVAYLTCDVHDPGPMCPYLGGLDRNKHVIQLAEELASGAGHWQCSPFLDIATPPELEAYVPRLPLYSARNEAAHEGLTTADDREVGNLWWLAEQSVLAGAKWFAAHPGQTVEDLDAEIDSAIARRGLLTVHDIRTSAP